MQRATERPHTKGPWVSKVDTVETTDGLVVCDVRHAGTHITGHNASLIAAAPDLLYVCQVAAKTLRERLLVASPWGGALVEALETIIAQATGAE